MRKIIAAVAALILVVLGGIAYASIPAADGTINGCYKNSGNHDLVVVDSAASCPSGYTALNWNQTGPQGPQGATGATGPQGPAGEGFGTLVTHVWRSDVAANNGETLGTTLSLTSGAELVDIGVAVGVPSGTGNSPTTMSTTANVVYMGPSNINVQSGTITPSGARVTVTDVAAGEAVWVTMTERQP